MRLVWRMQVAIICAGPVGRLLAVEWHQRQPRATVLELGSFFDPDLTERSFFARRGMRPGARYYADVQCGRRVNRSLYRPRTRHGACQSGPADVRAQLDERAIWARLSAAREQLSGV